MKGIKILISIALFVGVLLYAGLAEIVSVFFTLNPIVFVVVIPLFISIWFINTLALRVLYQTKELSFSSFLKEYIFSWSVGFLFPGKFGDFSLAYFVREKIPINHSLALIALDKIITFALSSVLTVIALTFFFHLTNVFLLYGFLILLWGAVLLFFISGRVRSIIKKPFTRFNKHFVGFSKTITEFVLRRKKQVFLNTCLTLVRYVINTLIIMTLFFGFGQQVDFLFVLLLVAATTTLSLIPVTISGIGLKQGVFVFLASTILIPIPIATAVILISTAINYVTVASIVALFPHKLSTRKMRVMGHE